MGNGVIILGDGSANSIGVLRSLNIANIQNILVTTSKNSPGNHSNHPRKHVFPNPNKYPENYIDHLLKLGKKHNDYVLIPTADTSVEVVSKNKKILEEQFRVPVPDWSILRKCVEKNETLKIAKKVGIKVPRTYRLENYDHLLQISEEIQFPCIAKGTTQRERDYIAKKVLKIHSREGLLRHGKRFLNDGILPIIQEDIPGSPQNLVALGSILNQRGAPQALLVVRKIHQIPFMYGVGTLTESTWDTEVVKQGLRFLREIGYYGVSHVEFKFDPRDGQYKFIEINPRTWLHVLLTTYSGLNFPEILYKMARGENIPLMDFRRGEKWHHLSSDIALLLSQVSRKDPHFSFIDFFKDYSGRRAFATFTLNDPGPMIQDMRNNLKRLTRLILA